MLGSDGSAIGKATVKQHIKDRYKRPGIYGEVSHAVEKLSQGSPVVCAVHVPKVLEKVVVPLENGVHYQRKIGSLGMVTKKMVGNPRGVPAGPENVCPLPDKPGEPITPNDAHKLAMEKVSQELDMAEHMACQLDWD